MASNQRGSLSQIFTSLGVLGGPAGDSMWIRWETSADEAELGCLSFKNRVLCESSYFAPESCRDSN